MLIAVPTEPAMPASALEWYGAVAAALTLSVMWMGEAACSLWAANRHPLQHGARNAALGLINGAARALFVPGLLLVVAEGAHAAGFGLFNWLGWPWWVELIGAVVLLDLWSYIWHVISHRAPLLWRFHAVHHHDALMDATTAFRFHVGDAAAVSLSMVAVVPLLGLSVVDVLAYEAILISTSIFHHANVRLPAGIERVLRWFIVTPAMHIVHHSRWHMETDSNYSSVFPWWDLLFGTLRRPPDPEAIRPGLDGYRERDHSTVVGMLMTPLGPTRSLPGVPRAEPSGGPIRTLPACPTPPAPTLIPNPARARALAG